MSETLKPPQQFGRYKIVKLLGAGAMGSVYLARDTQLERDVALKVPQFSEGKQPQILARFYQEARAAATIHHPHVCPVFDVGEIDGMSYLTMAYIEGKPLEDLISSGKPLSERLVATIGRKVADALSEAHKKGVIHRDLKPANIMLDKRGEPIVMDFGLAQRTREGNTRLTRTGTVMGSPAYMSPEQIKGETDTTGPGTDVFSLGVILYELLARRLPFEGGSVGEVHAQILFQEPPPLRQYCPDVSPALEAICMKALAKKAEDRHATMAQFASEIKGFLNGSTNNPGPTPAPMKPVPPLLKPDHSGLRGSAFAGRSQVVIEKEEAEARREKPKPRKKDKPVKKSAVPTWAWIVGGIFGLALVAGVAVAIGSKKNTAGPVQEEEPHVKSVVPEVVKKKVTPLPPMPHDPAFQPIFNGTDLTGWVIPGGRGSVWRPEKGELAFTANKEGSAVETREVYSDFTLRFEFLMSPGAEGEVVLRGEPGGSKELTVRLNDDHNQPHLGSIGTSKEPDHRAALNPPESWNWMEIDLNGQLLRVSVNGAEVNKVLLDDPSSSRYFGKMPLPLSGRIGFNALHGPGRLRNVVLKVIPPSPKEKEPAYSSLFNGTDFKADWKEDVGTPPNAWRVENNQLVSSGADPNGVSTETLLLTKKEYKDYQLRFEFMTTSGALSGVAPRAIEGQRLQVLVPVMHDAFARFRQLNDPTLFTGALRPVLYEKQAFLKPVEQWNTMKIKVHWPRIHVWVNDMQTVNASLESNLIPPYLGRSLPHSGKIGLLNSFGTVRYKKIEIQNLPEESAGPGKQPK